MSRDNSRTLRAYEGGLVPAGFYCSKKFSPPFFCSRQHYHLLCTRFTFLFSIPVSSTYYRALPHSLSGSFHIFTFSLFPRQKHRTLFSRRSHVKGSWLLRLRQFTPFSSSHLVPLCFTHTRIRLYFFYFTFLFFPPNLSSDYFSFFRPHLSSCEPLYATGMNSTHTHCTARAPYITPSYYPVIIIIINIHRAHSINRFKVEDYNGKKSQVPRCRIPMKTLIVTKR